MIDYFNDGDFSIAPTWMGDTSQFVVSGGFLPLNSAGNDSSFIATSYNIVYDTMEWRI